MKKKQYYYKYLIMYTRIFLKTNKNNKYIMLSNFINKLDKL